VIVYQVNSLNTIFRVILSRYCVSTVTYFVELLPFCTILNFLHSSHYSKPLNSISNPIPEPSQTSNTILYLIHANTENQDQNTTHISAARLHKPHKLNTISLTSHSSGHSHPQAHIVQTIYHLILLNPNPHNQNSSSDLFYLCVIPIFILSHPPPTH
jgi:hypothetical protein